MRLILVLFIILAITGLVIYRFKRRTSEHGQATRRRHQREPYFHARQSEIKDTAVSDSDAALGLAPKVEEKPMLQTIKTNNDDTATPEYIILHLVAPVDYPFGGYELLQSLLSNGLRYGDRNIFHRHETKTGRGCILFSLASLNKPGTFELSKMGSFSCPGLALFMLLKNVPDPMSAFDTLLETARQLTEDLGGEIWDEQRQPLNMDKVAQMRARIRHFEESQRTPDFFDETQFET